MPKISVIMPSLNVVNYIDEAVSSVINQTQQDIEIICVDAGSTDGTLERLEHFSSNYSCVKLIHSDIKSYGYQMNLGVKNATGEYIGIVETDDYIKPDMYEDLYDIAKTNDLDFVKSDYKKFWWDEDHSVYVNAAPSNDDYNVILTENNRASFYKYSSLNWTGIYRREYLLENDIWHSETPGASYQDIGFWLLNMSFAKRAMWVNMAFYMYRQDNPVASMKNRGKMLCSRDEYNRVLRILEEKGKKEEFYECLILKQMDYHVTFDRIDDSIKEQYLDEVASVYEKESHMVSVYEMQPFQATYFTWIKEAVSNKTELCNSIIDRNKQIILRLDDCERIYLYGAGQVARNVFMQLYSLGYWDKVEKVIVSSPGEENEFFRKQIVSFDECRSDLDNDGLIVVALGEKNRAEVMDSLKSCDIDNVLVPSDIAGLIYTI